MTSNTEKRKTSTKLVCINHPTVPASKKCERCGKLFCSECITEEWNSNFFGSLIGKRQDFEKHYFCRPCGGRSNKIRLVLSIGLLLVFLIPSIFFIIQFLLF